MTNEAGPPQCALCGRINARFPAACDCRHEFSTGGLRALQAVGPTEASEERIVRIARSYRSLLLWFVGTLLVQGGVRHLPGIAALIGLVVLLAMLAGMLVATYRLADDLDLMAPLWTIGMLVPVVNLVVLLMLSSKANKACRAAGLSVGLLGPSAPSIARSSR